MNSKIGINGYLGLFFVTLSTLMLEILLTRIFSVTMWYHFAFMAISIGMFGMTVGALLVYLFPKFFTLEKTKKHLSLSSFIFGLTVIFSFLTHLSMPYSKSSTFVGLYSLAMNYLVISIPFVFSGISVCLALTRFPSKINKLYAADLAGAAIGCIILIFVLDITDGQTAIFVVSLLALLSSLFFAIEANEKRLIKKSSIAFALILIFVISNTYLVLNQKGLIRMVWVKGYIEGELLLEKWNSFSRIKVTGDPNQKQEPFGWGFSQILNKEKNVNWLYMDIDASAGTIITKFDGDTSKLDYLRYDLTNIVHYLKRNSKVLVVGSGGGRDVLSALKFGQKEIKAVEINGNIISAVTKYFADYSGYLDKIKGVEFINDEARSYITRTEDKFDIIQISLIDTWAATAAGAFVLSENSLYTTDAWKIFLEKLNKDGVLSVSRWYFRNKNAEIYRTTSLAVASLKLVGVEDPSKHILIFRNFQQDDGSDKPDGIGTILVSKNPFSEADISILEQKANELKFDVVYKPGYSIEPVISKIVYSNKDFIENYPINISAPTDDSPFFFNMIRLSDVFKSSFKFSDLDHNFKAVFTLAALLVIVLILTILCIILPLFFKSKNSNLKGSLFYLIYFASIGFGFMFIEISQMQRLIVFLGHPIYGLSVVLFSLLLSSGQIGRAQV